MHPRALAMQRVPSEVGRAKVRQLDAIRSLKKGSRLLSITGTGEGRGKN